ncbi:uncharacterized protein C8Q71DRAFT_381892 [Rhodofomes roseus]|uniref:Uncharacterized protein n=1 Tax=Rhodofomes roseus TaxID=34475 RepID=A0ABQ8K0N4_9APHY|nr:uncharacterized protein C8Q71DRAFT_381892 [Rhodofomes roseus]KAH9830197.1 hypothetical protein C8Q71DRAFT_381892 [Rhodofomes roseus]
MRFSTILPLVSAAMLASSAVAHPISSIAFRNDADLAERAPGDLNTFRLLVRDYLGEQLAARAHHPGPFPDRLDFSHGESGWKDYLNERKNWNARKDACIAANKKDAKADKQFRHEQAFTQAQFHRAAQQANQHHKRSKGGCK